MPYLCLAAHWPVNPFLGYIMLIVINDAAVGWHWPSDDLSLASKIRSNLCYLPARAWQLCLAECLSAYERATVWFTRFASREVISRYRDTRLEKLGQDRISSCTHTEHVERSEPNLTRSRTRSRARSLVRTNDVNVLFDSVAMCINSA